MTTRAVIHADFARNSQPMDRLTVLAIRLGQQYRWMRPFCRFWIEVVVGAEVPFNVPIGPGLRLPHAGRGVIVHPNTRIGAEVTIYHRVTLGTRSADEAAPVIGDRAYLGTGATVLSGVRIGADAKVGAHALVVEDVPAGRTATGPKATTRR